jgi:hypothetical protein
VARELAAECRHEGWSVAPTSSMPAPEFLGSFHEGPPWMTEGIPDDRSSGDIGGCRVLPVWYREGGNDLARWGEGLYDDDVAIDVRARFGSILARGLPPAEAARRISKDLPSDDETDGRHVSILALADLLLLAGVMLLRSQPKPSSASRRKSPLPHQCLSGLRC